ncbi:rod-binding protein [Hyphomicrobium sp.]|uniref:rod-binding protein n=1 Tax=Hyphomicrobium sp. TaxID=82 RepID=UPI0025B88536|nr:rod-binding protein [Hyphomicrobium sp.]
MPTELTIRPIGEAQADRASEVAVRAPHGHKNADAAQKFEAFVLQTFIQEMMPETQESVFGSGISGDFWKSMLAEKVAEQVAARGSIGIADTVRAGYAAPVARSGGFNPLDLMGRTLSLDGVAAQLDVNPVSGE